MPEQEKRLSGTEARQGRRVGLIWILFAGTVLAVAGLGIITALYAA